MSKIGKKPIVVPASVEVKIDDGFLFFKSSNGNMKLEVPRGIKAELKENELTFSPENKLRLTQALWGTARALANNAINGLSSGFEKSLKLEGVGYRAAMEGEALVLNLGLSHPIKFIPPQGVKISVDKNVIQVKGYDKGAVGQSAAKIRAFKKPEPYKGKGIRYSDEIIRRKAGKKVAGTAK
ncbi:MAG: 50S ribosomal protein L6 [Candidatus Paceibacterota bacterium]